MVRVSLITFCALVLALASSGVWATEDCSTLTCDSCNASPNCMYCWNAPATKRRGEHLDFLDEFYYSKLTGVESLSREQHRELYLETLEHVLEMEESAGRRRSQSNCVSIDYEGDCYLPGQCPVDHCFKSNCGDCLSSTADCVWCRDWTFDSGYLCTENDGGGSSNLCTDEAPSYVSNGNSVCPHCDEMTTCLECNADNTGCQWCGEAEGRRGSEEEAQEVVFASDNKQHIARRRDNQFCESQEIGFGWGRRENTCPFPAFQTDPVACPGDTPLMCELQTTCDGCVGSSDNCVWCAEKFGFDHDVGNPHFKCIQAESAESQCANEDQLAFSSQAECDATWSPCLAHTECYDCESDQTCQWCHESAPDYGADTDLSPGCWAKDAEGFCWRKNIEDQCDADTGCWANSCESCTDNGCTWCFDWWSGEGVCVGTDSPVSHRCDVNRAYIVGDEPQDVGMWVSTSEPEHVCNYGWPVQVRKVEITQGIQRWAMDKTLYKNKQTWAIGYLVSEKAYDVQARFRFESDGVTAYSPIQTIASLERMPWKDDYRMKLDKHLVQEVPWNILNTGEDITATVEVVSYHNLWCGGNTWWCHTTVDGAVDTNVPRVVLHKIHWDGCGESHVVCTDETIDMAAALIRRMMPSSGVDIEIGASITTGAIWDFAPLLESVGELFLDDTSSPWAVHVGILGEEPSGENWLCGPEQGAVPGGMIVQGQLSQSEPGGRWAAGNLWSLEHEYLHAAVLADHVKYEGEISCNNPTDDDVITTDPQLGMISEAQTGNSAWFGLELLKEDATQVIRPYIGDWMTYCGLRWTGMSYSYPLLRDFVDNYSQAGHPDFHVFHKRGAPRSPVEQIHRRRGTEAGIRVIGSFVIEGGRSTKVRSGPRTVQEARRQMCGASPYEGQLTRIETLSKVVTVSYSDKDEPFVVGYGYEGEMDYYGIGANQVESTFGLPSSYIFDQIIPQIAPSKTTITRHTARNGGYPTPGSTEEDKGDKKLCIYYQDACDTLHEIACETQSDNAPTVTIDTPTGSTVESGLTVTVSFSYSDTDTDSLSMTKIFYSPDGGISYSVVHTDVKGKTSFDIPTATLKASTTAMFKVQVSDGFNTAEDESEQFELQQSQLDVSITPSKITVTADPAAGGFPDKTILRASVLNKGAEGLTYTWWANGHTKKLGEGAGLVLSPRVLGVGEHTLDVDVTSTVLSGSMSVSVTVECGGVRDCNGGQWDAATCTCYDCPSGLKGPLCDEICRTRFATFPGNNGAAVCTLPEQSWPTGSSSFTLAMYVRTDRSGLQYALTFGWSVMVYQSASDHLVLYLQGHTFDSGVSINDGEWHLVDWRYDTSVYGVRLLVDSVQVYEQTYSITSFYPGTATLVVGANGIDDVSATLFNSATAFEGSLDSIVLAAGVGPLWPSPEWKWLFDNLGGASAFGANSGEQFLKSTLHCSLRVTQTSELCEPLPKRLPIVEVADSPHPTPSPTLPSWPHEDDALVVTQSGDTETTHLMLTRGGDLHICGGYSLCDRLRLSGNAVTEPRDGEKYWRLLDGQLNAHVLWGRHDSSVSELWACGGYELCASEISNLAPRHEPSESFFSIGVDGEEPFVEIDKNGDVFACGGRPLCSLF